MKTTEYLQCWSEYADFNGRARRSELWTWLVVNFLLIFLLSESFWLYHVGRVDSEQCVDFLDFLLDCLDTFLGPGLTGGKFSGLGLILKVFGMSAVLPGLAVLARRYHDAGQPGWLCLLAYLAGVGLLIFGRPLVIVFKSMDWGTTEPWVALAHCIPLAVILGVALCAEGTHGENRYGKDPKEVEGKSEAGRSSSRS